MEKDNNSRRSFIRNCLGLGILAAGGAMVLNSCSGGETNKKAQTTPNKSFTGNPCDDLSGVSESEIAKRKGLGYVTESYVPGSHCDNCNNYIPPKPGEKCGGCLLFKGPVRPTGYCTQYQPKTA